MPAADRPRWTASTKVVPMPHIGSRTNAPGLVNASITRAARAGSILPGCRIDSGR